MIDPSNLMALARALIVGRDGLAPNSETIRRAISTAYYALFHTILKDGAERFIGVNDTSVAFETIYRGFDHSQINRVLVAVNKQILSEVYQKRLRRLAVSQDIRDFATVFVLMQEQRHLADYSPLTQFSQAEASNLIAEVDLALSIFARADTGEKTDLLAVMLVGKRAA